MTGAVIPAKCAPSLKATLLFKSEERMHVIAALRDHFEPDSSQAERGESCETESIGEKNATSS